MTLECAFQRLGILTGTNGNDRSVEAGLCGQRKKNCYQMQTRSVDEPMTMYATCVNCNNHWKFCWVVPWRSCQTSQVCDPALTGRLVSAHLELLLFLFSFVVLAAWFDCSSSSWLHNGHRLTAFCTALLIVSPPISVQLRQMYLLCCLLGFGTLLCSTGANVAAVRFRQDWHSKDHISGSLERKRKLSLPSFSESRTLQPSRLTFQTRLPPPRWPCPHHYATGPDSLPCSCPDQRPGTGLDERAFEIPAFRRLPRFVSAYVILASCCHRSTFLWSSLCCAWAMVLRFGDTVLSSPQGARC